jgi:hypothetical protein
MSACPALAQLAMPWSQVVRVPDFRYALIMVGVMAGIGVCGGIAILVRSLRSRRKTRRSGNGTTVMAQVLPGTIRIEIDRRDKGPD